MKEIVPKLPTDQIESELTEDKFLRETNKGGNQLYVVTAHNSPNIMHEIGRLREITFRHAGGGTGMETDIDFYDTCEIPYKQLIVWNPDSREILGGYRYLLGNNLSYNAQGEPNIATSHLFHFTEKFTTEYLPYTIELGRSFVHPDYQSSKAGAKALYALDNLWDGLGALSVDHPEMRYYFGKVTMYTHFNLEARNYILAFLNKYFNDHEELVYPKEKYLIRIDFQKYEKVFTNNNIKDDYKILSKKVRSLGENIPPLVNAYMNLSPTMRSFGTAINDTFGDVEETGILVTIKDIYDAKKDRHIKTYLSNRNASKLARLIKKLHR
ncbi:MAG TPA: GNAT family N-acetyltransferase [Prolixibacteraceae bacterium]|nr:GNAT family N-acetyltransferase [Prolixibacteraceae bacterium]HPS12605.1 GNAT family N-acetyltransferase [Prolixibacteraceae bacterium]